MTDGIGRGGGLPRDVLGAALARMQEAHARVRGEQAQKEGLSFSDVVRESLRQVDEGAKRVDGLHLDVLEGKLDLHEAAAQLQQAKLSMDFAMQVRDRFIDAYREVMRMNV